MLRNVVLVLASLGVLVVLWLAYSAFVGRPVQVTQQRERDLPPQIEQTSEPLRVGEEIEVPGGGRIVYRVFDERTGRPTDLFSCEAWRPLPGSKNEIEVDQPELAMLLPSGMIASVRAEQGQLFVDRVERAQMRPRQGWLAGHVRIEIDRETAVDRTPRDERPEDVITIHVDRLEFDLLRGQLRTADRLRVACDDFDIVGTGLDLVWSAQANRLETLTIAQGESFTFYTGGGVFGALGGAPPSTQPASAPASAPATEEKATDKPPVKRRRSATGYLCRLTGGVTATQFQADQPVAGLTADEIRLLFDVGAGAGGFLRRASASQPASRPVRDATNRLVVQWGGPLVIEPQRVPAGLDRARLHFVAEGTPAVLHRADQSLRCRKVEYHDESQRIWVDAPPGESVAIAVGDSMTADAAGVFVDQLADGRRIVKLTGPVLLRSQARQAAAARVSNIRCAQWAELLVARGQGPAGPALEAALEFTGLESATFVGDVAVALAAQRLVAQRLEVTFRAAADQTLEALLDSALASGQVHLADDGGTLACWELALAFDRTTDQRLYPRRIDARGAVELTRRTTRGEHPLAAVLGDVAGWARPAPARIRGDRVIADLAALDDTIAPTAAQSRTAEFVIRRLEVRGDADLRDPRNRVAARGDTIAARFIGLNELATATVTGTSDAPGLVHAAPYTVQGERIDLDRAAQTLGVNGPARLSLHTRRSLQGERRDRLTRVAVESGESLLIDGRGNEVRFAGHVTARSGDERLECQRLTLVLEDLPDTDAAAVPRLSLWRALRRMAGAERPAPMGDALAVRVERTERMRKELRRVIAEQALVTTETFAPGGTEPLVHASIAAPELRVEVAERRILTFGETTMLVTDHRDVADDAAAEAALGLPSALLSRGASQTAMRCLGRMIYTLGPDGPDRRDAVVLEDGVRFVHRTGAHLIVVEPAVQPVADATEPGRDALLDCERLECWLATRAGEEASEATSFLQSPTRLASLTASGNVYLRDRTGSREREVFAAQLEFNRERGQVQVRGTNGEEARVYSSDRVAQRFDVVTARQVLINLREGEIRAADIAGEARRP